MIGKLLTLVIVLGTIPDHVADLANGAVMFWAGGCESCHAVANARGDDELRLGGGQVLSTPFGRFHVPNISPDPDHGIGEWTLAEFVNAMKHGVAPGGVHLYPAFPYPAYQRMRTEDIIDLKGFLDTLPPVAGRSQPNELAFPYNLRRGIGLWKLLYADGKAFGPDPAASAQVNRGAYLVAGPGHCGECHTPRNFLGGPKRDRFLAGGKGPDGKGVPNLTPAKLKSWSDGELQEFLTTGITADGDVTAEAMGEVITNTLSRITAQDLAAIIAYLRTLPALPDAPR